MELELNKYGFYSLVNKPSAKALEEYYAKKYYQNASGNYEQEYSEDEIRYFKNKIAQRYYIIERFLKNDAKPALLDVGCGEGWALGFFKEKGWDISGLDYSGYASERFNPDCRKDIIAGDIYANLEQFVAEGRQFDVVWLDNVLEHVLDPEGLVLELRKLTKIGGVLVAEVPNDFSEIQAYALKKGYIDRKYWIVVPDHISYFNRNGMNNLMQAHGWSSVCFLSDYPIDWNILNPDTNYISDKTKGKNCHRERVEFENLLHQMGIEKAIALYKSLAEIGMGRQITGFFQPI